MNIHTFPLSPERVYALIKECVRNNRVQFLCISEKGGWYELTTRRQVIKCLTEGALTHVPETNAHGDIECVLEHICSGVNVRVNVILRDMDGWTSIIVNVENRT